jgi:hypothetical protein
VAANPFVSGDPSTTDYKYSGGVFPKSVKKRILFCPSATDNFEKWQTCRPFAQKCIKGQQATSSLRGGYESHTSGSNATAQVITERPARLCRETAVSAAGLKKKELFDVNERLPDGGSLCTMLTVRLRRLQL